MIWDSYTIVRVIQVQSNRVSTFIQVVSGRQVREIEVITPIGVEVDSFINSFDEGERLIFWNAGREIDMAEYAKKELIRTTFSRSLAIKVAPAPIINLREAMRRISISGQNLNTSYALTRNAVDTYLNVPIREGYPTTWLLNFYWHFNVYYRDSDFISAINPELIVTPYQKTQFLQCVALWMAHAISDLAFPHTIPDSNPAKYGMILNRLNLVVLEEKT